ncbi:GNAT family N-acetyltransferase [Planobispora takensis]|uniref:N-acetyltransferase domain-containing protein n=1 Tax=Planobispora takensis TaxID=1367882 RepID=A0A8J3TAV1_9ACTN|nr:hypothetical protein [Planobispora takensis]GII04039.1 hypothetical protein Pta02_60470 [Planobispora takensis]
MTGLSVAPVTRRADMTAFIRFPYLIYRPEDPWIPPLERERRAFLDPRRNPFFDYAEAGLFLARRDGRAVGRIAAVRNPRHNELHGPDEGFFGLFECVDDPVVACALFDTAADWLHERGLRTVLGPVSLSTNHECGLLVDSFDRAPAVLMPYNPAYYPRLVEGCGFVKAKDLWAWELDWDRMPGEFLPLAERLDRDSRYTIRPLLLRDLDTDATRVWAVYNEVWSDNWGFVPATEKEFRHLVRALKPILRPELTLVAEDGGEIVGALIGIPDAGPAFRAARGRLTPLGLMRFTRAMRRLDAGRLVLLGVRARNRDDKVVFELGVHGMRAARALGIRRVEFSWILEDNAAANGVARYIGARRSKTYRIYRRGP